MYAYGTTIRKIRLNKGMTQKEVYLGIVSRSFYADFEKGNYRIEASKFSEMLKRLAYSQEEFLYVHNDYTKSHEKELEEHVRKLYREWDLEALLDFYTTYHTSKNRGERYSAYYAYSLVYMAADNSSKMSADPVNELVAYLSSVRNWSLQDLKYYESISGSFIKKSKQEKELSEKAWQSIQRYETFNEQEYTQLVADYMLSKIQRSLINQEYREAEECFETFTEISEGKRMGEVALIYKTCELIIGFYQNASYWQEAEEFLQALEKIEEDNRHLYAGIIDVHKGLSQGLSVGEYVRKKR